MSAPFPPSMPAGSHEMRDSFSNQDPPRSTPHTAPSITPYLGLRARLSQVPINRWTILLLLVLAKTLLTLASIHHDLGSARSDALAACSDVESLGSTMASMPHYMSQGINELTATGIDKSVNGLMSMSTMSVTAVEEIVVFVIGMMTNTYLCLITMAVDGSLSSAINIIESSQKSISALGPSVGSDIQKIMGPFDTSYTKLLNELKGVSIGSLSLGNMPAAPNFTAQINELNNFKLPTDLDADLQKLNSSLPTFAQVKNVTEGLIRTPFELVKSQVIGNFSNYTFDRSVFPVPAKQQLTFCSDNNGINDFFDKLDDMVSLGKKIFIAVLIVAAIAVMAPMAYREVYRWRKQQARCHLISGAGQNAADPMDVQTIVGMPFRSMTGMKIAGIQPHQEAIAQSSRRQIMTRWAVNYAATDAALLVLFLAIGGFFACLCEYTILKAIETKVPELTNEVGNFADKVVSTLEGSSASWASDTNNVIAKEAHNINTNMLSWVNISTSAINDVLDAFISNTTSVLNSTFGGTPLQDPVNEVFNCLVGLKVAGLQNGLDWVSEHAQVNFPLLPNDTFSLGALSSVTGGNSSDSFLSTPGGQASDKISAAVDRFTSALQNQIRTEALISTVVFAIWLAVALIGICYAIYKCFGHDTVRGMGGAPPADSIGDRRPAMQMSNTRDFTSDDQDRFTNVPLTDYNTRQQKSTFESAPLPEYSERDQSGSEVSDDGLSDQKRFNHGAQRTFTLEDATRNRHRSEYGDVFGDHNKI